MAKGIGSVRVGHLVTHREHPLLWGKMLVVEVTRKGRAVESLSCLPDPHTAGRTELFWPGELEIYEAPA
jgi:hypothetical protein